MLVLQFGQQLCACVQLRSKLVDYLVLCQHGLLCVVELDLGHHPEIVVFGLHDRLQVRVLLFVYLLYLLEKLDFRPLIVKFVLV